MLHLCPDVSFLDTAGESKGVAQVNEELTAASFETPSQKPRKVRQMRVNICGTSRSFLELMST